MHIRPPGGFNTSQATRFARYVTDRGFHITDKIIPDERRRSIYAISNFEVRPRPSAEALAGDLSFSQLVDVMMPREGDYGGDECPIRKGVAWNFLPLLNPRQGTIEFRQPPHVSDFIEAEAWIQLTLCICYYALHWE